MCNKIVMKKSKLIPLSVSIPFFPEDCLYRWHWIEESISVLSLLNQKWSEIATPSLIFILNSTFLSCKLCLIFFFLHIPCSQFFVLTIGLLFCFLPECINNCICRCFILCDLISFPPSPFTCSVFFFSRAQMLKYYTSPIGNWFKGNKAIFCSLLYLQI